MTIRYEDDMLELKGKYESCEYICVVLRNAKYEILHLPTFSKMIDGGNGFYLIHKKHEDILKAYLDGKDIEWKVTFYRFATCNDFINTYQENTEYRIKETKSSCEDVKSYNIGTSNYSDMTIQPYDIFEAHPQLNYWECDIIKRILRSKSTDSRLMDYEKIEHIIKYLIKREKDKQ